MSLDAGNMNDGETGADLLEKIGVSTSRSLVASAACQIGSSNTMFMVSSLFKDNDGKKDTPYDIFLVGDNHVTDDLIEEMAFLQDKICPVPAPHADNPVDYKSRRELQDHFIAGGQAIIFAAGDQLIGCCMLSEDASPGLSGVFQKGVDNMPDVPVLKVGFLAVNPDFSGFKLAQRLLQFAEKTAKVDGYEGIEAGVRLWNTRAIRRFSGSNFVGTSTYQNPKDGCQVLKMGKVFGEPLSLDTQKGWDRLIDDPASQADVIEASLERGGVLTWHQTGDRVAIYPNPGNPLAFEG